jgi:hypothetical protein
MLPPIYTTLQASATVRSLLGARPRVYRFGEAPQDKAKPYVVWQVISGLPENTLGELPSIDRDSIQVDVYAKEDAECEEVARAVRDRMEEVTYMTAFRSPPREPETRLFRISMDFDYWLPREETASTSTGQTWDASATWDAGVLWS